MRSLLLLLVLFVVFAAPAGAQHAPAACAAAGAERPTLPVVGERTGATSRPGASRPEATPRAALGRCEARGAGGLVEVIQEQWTGAAWERVTRGRFERNAADSLTLIATDVWDGAAWQPDVLDTYDYTPEGRIAEHTSRYWVGPDAINDYRERFTYDDAGRVAEYVYQIGTAEGWDDNARALPAYDASGRPTAVTTELWTGAAWVGFAYQTYAYDADGRLATETRANWDGAAYVPAERQQRLYDAATGALTRWTFEAWTGTAWADTGRETYAVDAAGRTVEHLGEAFENGAWVPILRDRYAYLGAQGPETTAAESRSWDAEAGAWGFGFREALAHDAAGRRTAFTYQTLDGPGETATDLFRELYTVDAGGRRTETVFQNSEGGVWVNASQTLYAVGVDGRPSVDLDNAWTGSAWEPSRRLTYRYDGSVAGEPRAEPPPAGTAIALTAGPNPTRGALRVALHLDAPTEAALDVFDARGRRVARLASGAQPAGTQTLVFDTARLAPGVYTVRLEADGQAVSRTVVVVR